MFKKAIYELQLKIKGIQRKHDDDLKKSINRKLCK